MGIIVQCQKLVLVAILKQNHFFFQICFKNVNVSMFFTFEPNFIAKFLWKSGFSNFDHLTFFVKRKFVFWPPFWNETFLIVLFADIWLFVCVCTHCASFVPKFLQEGTQKWMGPSGPPPPLCTNGSEKVKVTSREIDSVREYDSTKPTKLKCSK